MNRSFSAFLADPDPRSRESLRSALAQLGFSQIVGEADNGQEAARLALWLKPQVVFLSTAMEDPGWVETATSILAATETRLVVLTDRDDVEVARAALQVGAQDLLHRPVDVQELRQALGLAAAPTAAPTPPAVTSNVLACFSTKGGVGKTTLSVNLATAIARQIGRSVALLDLDLEFGSAATFFGLRPKQTLADLCADGEIDQAKLHHAMEHPVGTHVDLLAAPADREGASRVDGENLPTPAQGFPDRVARILTLLRREYPWIVVDMGCSFRRATLTALDQADTIFLVTTPDVQSLENARSSLDVLLNKLDYPPGKVRVILNRSNSSLGFTYNTINRVLGTNVSFSLPSDPQATFTALTAGRPLVLHPDPGPLSDAIRQLGSLVIGALPPPPQTAPRPWAGWARHFLQTFDRLVSSLSRNSG